MVKTTHGLEDIDRRTKNLTERLQCECSFGPSQQITAAFQPKPHGLLSMLVCWHQLPLSCKARHIQGRELLLLQKLEGTREGTTNTEGE